MKNRIQTYRELLQENLLEYAGTGTVLEIVDRDLRRSGYAGPTETVLLIYLAATTRLFERPVSIAVRGLSAAGKSFAIKTGLRFLPPEAYVEVTAMSEKALLYWSEDLRHRMLVIAEGAGISGEFFAYAIRSLLSEGRLEYVVTDFDSKNAQTIRQEGPTGLITSTTGTIDPELATRLVMPSVADTPDHTREILRATATRAAGEVETIDHRDHHDIQRRAASGPCEVIVPFARQLAELVDPIAVRIHRDFPAVLELVKAHALLHRHDRPRDEAGRIVATLFDYDVVFGLAAPLIAEAAERSIPETVRETVAAVRELSFKIARPDEPATIGEIAAKLGISRSAASRRVGRSVGLGYLADASAGQRGKPRRLEIGDPMPEDVGVLPPVEALR